MSICIIAAVVLGIMGVFSAKYRRWAKEAFSCVARRLTLRPCESSFNQRVKAKVTGKLMHRSPGAARLVNKHFEALSWVFTIILFTSLIITSLSVYNLAVYGTCDPANPDQCIISIDPTCGEPGQCDPECEFPDYTACGGDCSCLKQSCENIDTFGES